MQASRRGFLALLGGAALAPLLPAAKPTAAAIAGQTGWATGEGALYVSQVTPPSPSFGDIWVHPGDGNYTLSAWVRRGGADGVWEHVQRVLEPGFEGPLTLDVPGEESVNVAWSVLECAPTPSPLIYTGDDIRLAS